MIREFKPICTAMNCHDPHCDREHVCPVCLLIDDCQCCAVCNTPDCEHCKEEEEWNEYGCY